jgi:hypothetical protein
MAISLARAFVEARSHEHSLPARSLALVERVAGTTRAERLDDVLHRLARNAGLSIEVGTDNERYVHVSCRRP